MTPREGVFVLENWSAGTRYPLVITHGGVDMEPSEATFATLEQAATTGLASFHGDMDGIEAAVAALAILEDDPLFNAGFGSVLTRSATVETDGAVSSGHSGRAVGVGAVPGLRRPAALAQRVMQNEEAVLLVGPRAAEYAQAIGIELEDLVTEEQLSALEQYSENPWRSVFTGRGLPTETVGSLTVNALGHVSSASSTGGLLGKLPGRVGDACIVGGGYWTDQRYGILCSGSGEAAMNRHLARSVSHHAQSVGLAEAVQRSLAMVTEGSNAVCAIVAVDALLGEVTTAHNGRSFPVVVATGGGLHRMGETIDPTIPSEVL